MSCKVRGQDELQDEVMGVSWRGPGEAQRGPGEALGASWREPLERTPKEKKR